jgi:hypothetical protein
MPGNGPFLERLGGTRKNVRGIFFRFFEKTV